MVLYRKYLLHMLKNGIPYRVWKLIIGPFRLQIRIVLQETFRSLQSDALLILEMPKVQNMKWFMIQN